MKSPSIQRDVIAPYRGCTITAQSTCSPNSPMPKAYNMQLCVMVASDTDEQRYSPAESCDINLDYEDVCQLIEILEKHRERIARPEDLTRGAA